MVISGIFGILKWERAVMSLQASGAVAWTATGVPGPTRDTRPRSLLHRLHEEEDGGDDEHVQGQRLDERQPDDHRGLDTRGGPGLAGHGLHGGGGRPALAQSAETG